MNILLAASEVFPYAKTGGLADVAGALPKALARLGHRVRIIMPRYNLDRIVSAGELLPQKLEVPFAFGTRHSAVYIDSSGQVPVYFVDSPEYFARGRLYGESDEGERFAYFCRSVVEFARSLGERLDIIHLNDWMTGLVAAYLKTVYAGDQAVSRLGTVFTIHNLAFPGFFDAGILPRVGLPETIFRTEAGIEFYGQASALKAGLVFSDALTTVSPRYSWEIQTPELGERFEGLLRARAGQLYGILNGVDYEEWSPDVDGHIAASYSMVDLRGKAECKRDLLQSFGLPVDLDRPLIGCISRLSDQKGFDLILDIAGRILDRGVAFVLLGSGAEVYERAFQ